MRLLLDNPGLPCSTRGSRSRSRGLVGSTIVLAGDSWKLAVLLLWYLAMLGRRLILEGDGRALLWLPRLAGAGLSCVVVE